MGKSTKKKNKKITAPKANIQELSISRDGGQIALRGYSYQFLYSCYLILSSSNPSNFFQLEGIEDIDCIMQKNGSNDITHIQLKYSVNKQDASFLTDVLKNFLEAYLLDQNRFFKLVYDFPVAKGHLSKIFASKLDEKSRTHWAGVISNIKKNNPSWNWSVYDFDKFISHSVLDFMVDYYDLPEFKDKKIFFVTTLKKNLPDKELREHFARRGKADDYDKYCLRIEANADMIVEKLDELYRARKIPTAITMKQEFKDLHGSVKLLIEYRDKKRELKGTSREIINVLCKSAEDAIRKQQEGSFRKVIESELKQFRTPKEKLKNIANNPDYHWIGELYPAVYTREKRILFMSMDKFFLGNTTIIEPTYSFYNNDITKNAIIFIDEFDATRDRILKQIITRGLENHIDYLGLFHRVYASLKTRDFPAELTTASKLQQAYLDEHKNAKNPMEIIEGFGGVFDETYDRFAMQYSFKTEEDGKGDRSRNFIFTN